MFEFLKRPAKKLTAAGVEGGVKMSSLIEEPV